MTETKGVRGQYWLKEGDRGQREGEKKKKKRDLWRQHRRVGGKEGEGGREVRGWGRDDGAVREAKGDHGTCRKVREQKTESLAVEEMKKMKQNTAQESLEVGGFGPFLG